MTQRKLWTEQGFRSFARFRPYRPGFRIQTQSNPYEPAAGRNKKGRPAARPSLSQGACLGDYLVAGFFSVTSPFFSVAFLDPALTEVAIIFPSFSV